MLHCTLPARSGSWIYMTTQMGSPTSIRTSNFCSPVATPAAMVSNLYALPPLVGGQFIPLVVAPVEGGSRQQHVGQGAGRRGWRGRGGGRCQCATAAVEDSNSMVGNEDDEVRLFPMWICMLSLLWMLCLLCCGSVCFACYSVDLYAHGYADACSCMSCAGGMLN